MKIDYLNKTFTITDDNGWVWEYDLFTCNLLSITYYPSRYKVEFNSNGLIIKQG